MARATEKEQAEVAALLSASTGMPADELDGTIWLESGWDPGARNPHTGASGLIQIMPYHLKRWGTSGETLRALSAHGQVPFIERYYREANATGRWRIPGDTYLAVAAPIGLGKPDSYVIYPRGSKAWRANHGWRPADGGDITAGSIRAVLTRWIANRAHRIEPDPGGPIVPTPPAARAPRLPTKGWWVLVGLGLAWAAGRRR